MARRTVSEKVLKDRAYKITVNPKFDEYKRELASMVYTHAFLHANVNEVTLTHFYMQL